MLYLVYLQKNISLHKVLKPIVNSGALQGGQTYSYLGSWSISQTQHMAGGGGQRCNVISLQVGVSTKNGIPSFALGLCFHHWKVGFHC